MKRIGANVELEKVRCRQRDKTGNFIGGPEPQ